MINKKFQKNMGINSGYTLLFAVLVSALVLAIAISILSISKKEFLLATSARDSSTAFYAADSGVECAVYGDDKGAFLDSSNQYTHDKRLDYATTMGCKFKFSPIHVDVDDTDLNNISFTFDGSFGSAENGSCGHVVVRKMKDENGDAKTDIESRGYNTGWDSSNKICATPGPKRVERAIHYRY